MDTLDQKDSQENQEMVEKTQLSEEQTVENQKNEVEIQSTDNMPVDLLKEENEIVETKPESTDVVKIEIIEEEAAESVFIDPDNRLKEETSDVSEPEENKKEPEIEFSESITAESEQPVEIDAEASAAIEIEQSAETEIAAEPAAIETEQSSEVESPEPVIEETVQLVAVETSESVIEETMQPVAVETSESVMAEAEQEPEKEKAEEQEEEHSVISEEKSEKKELQGNVETEESVVSDEPLIDYLSMSAEELVAHAKELMSGAVASFAALKVPMDEIKQHFYRLFKQKQDGLKKAFLESGGEENDFTPPVDALEEDLKSILTQYKEKKNAEIQAVEKEKQDNLNAKNRILEELKGLVENADDFGKKIPIFQKLQQEWKAIGQVPASEIAGLWKNYQLYIETFYDNLKINNELRDYDFRKNLEAKTTLCEQAEKLAEETDIIPAFRRLQLLHEEWREIGPVSRDQRENIWDRFREASSVINKKHHDYFDKLREGEAENLALKTALCEKAEAIEIESISTYKEWQEKTDEVVVLQEEWKKIGFAPKKDNVAIYERFRSACDVFFQKKNEFYKGVREQLNENLAKKTSLCEKAEALKDSENWKETGDKMIQLQKEWKEIGPVPKRQSEIVWKRFISACDHFFEQKNKNFKSQKEEQLNNLKQKKELIDQINALEAGENQSESFTLLKALIVEWNEIGHVPFKEKDKIYKEYKTAIDKQFDRLNMGQLSRRMDFFKANIEELGEKGQQRIFVERKKLMRTYDTLTNEIATYENNIGFFSGSSKNAEEVRKDMEQKIAKLKEDRNIVIEKIKMLEETAKK